MTVLFSFLGCFLFLFCSFVCLCFFRGGSCLFLFFFLFWQMVAITYTLDIKTMLWDKQYVNNICNFCICRKNVTDRKQLYVRECHFYMDSVKSFFLWCPYYHRHNKRWLEKKPFCTVHCERCIAVWLHFYQRESTSIVWEQHNDILWYFFFTFYLMLLLQCHQSRSSVYKVFCVH